jgi:hypothetical protein
MVTTSFWGPTGQISVGLTKNVIVNIIARSDGVAEGKPFHLVSAAGLRSPRNRQGPGENANPALS